MTPRIAPDRIARTVRLIALVGVSTVAIPRASSQAVVRRPLLTASLTRTKGVDRVEIKEVRLAAHQAGGAHLHPCPVVGQVVSGTILFQVEGRTSRILKAGDAFFEPPNTVIEHFDSQSGPARFTAYYLLGKGETKLVVLLGKDHPSPTNVRKPSPRLR